MKTISKILVIDLEATCTEDPKEKIPIEIIEVGMCLLTVPTGELKPLESFYVRPSKKEYVTTFCTELTGLDWEKLKFGYRFQDVLRMLLKIGAKNTFWASYGVGDKQMIENQCAREGLTSPFSDFYMDVASLFSLQYNQGKSISLQNALKKVGLDFVGAPHRADVDAYNTACLLKYCLGYTRK